MKQALITFTFIAGIFFFSFGQISNDSIHKMFLKEYEIPERNYNVDKFEHVIFTDITPFSGLAFTSMGYDFVYNFSKIARFMPGIGIAYRPGLIGSVLRTNFQLGSKLVRLELGNSLYVVGSKNWSSFYISPSIGLNFRHGRGIEFGFVWAPNIQFEKTYGGSGNLFNLKFQVRFYGVNKKRRRELGPWKGLHPFEYKLSPKFSSYKRKYKKTLKK